MTAPEPRAPETAPVEIRCVRAPNAGPLTLSGTNTYLVRDGDQVWVVDPGPRDGAHLDAIVAAGALDRGARPAGILITHRHADHAEAAGTLRRHLSQRAGTPVPLWAVDTGAVPGAEPPPARVTGDRGAVGHVIHLPGHTADSIGLLVQGGRLLVGDTLLGGSSTLIASPDGSVAEYLRSLDVLAALCEDGRISAILPGHGDPYDEPTAALEAVREAAAHRRERIEAVRAARARGLLTMPRLLRAIYGDDLAPELRDAAEGNMRATIAYLVDGA